MRPYFILALGSLVVWSFSAHAQLSKHDQSIANHSYSVPIVIRDTPVLAEPGTTLYEDVEKGIISQPPIMQDVAPLPKVEEMKNKEMPPSMPPAKSLKKEIDQEIQKKTLNNAFEERQVDLQKLVLKALGEGQQAKDFALPNHRGENVILSQELAKGPVVLIWYRGGWCPYCNIQLKSFQDELDTLTAAGAQLIAISPETPDNSLTTAQKNNLNFHVLSDVGSSVAREYGLVYTAPDDLFEKLPTLDLKKHNGVNSHDLPLTATYVIEPDGTITYAMITPDHRERAQPADVITVLGDIAAKESIQKSRLRQAMEREAEKLNQENKTGQKAQDSVTPSSSRIEKLEETVTIKPAKEIDSKVDLKPIVSPPPVGVEPETTLEVRAKEEGLIPESY